MPPPLPLSPPPQTPDVAVFTNLTQDHLDYHGSMDEYKRSKLMLFEAMAAPVYEAEERLAEMDAEIARLEGGVSG